MKELVARWGLIVGKGGGEVTYQEEGIVRCSRKELIVSFRVDFLPLALSNIVTNGVHLPFLITFSKKSSNNFQASVKANPLLSLIICNVILCII